MVADVAAELLVAPGEAAGAEHDVPGRIDADEVRVEADHRQAARRSLLQHRLVIVESDLAARSGVEDEVGIRDVLDLLEVEPFEEAFVAAPGEHHADTAERLIERIAQCRDGLPTYGKDTSRGRAGK